MSKRISSLSSSRSTGDWSTLVGKWFHTFCAGGRVEQQGEIIGMVGDGYYVVRLFEWIGGSETRRLVAHLDELVRERWALYETGEQMRECYDHEIGVRRHDGRSVCVCQGRNDGA